MIRSRAKSNRKAVVLLAVLVVVVLLSLAAYKYSDYMLSEYRANEASIKATQARLNADSGVHYTAAMLAAEAQGGNTLGGNPWDNPGVFQNVAVGNPDDQGRQPGRFTIRSLRSPDDLAINGGLPYAFGVEDEASKINLNSLLALDGGAGDIGMQILMSFSNLGMTEDVAAAILDWMDPDDTPRTSGAENEYYSALAQPYKCKNGPLDSLEELLLVRGVTPQLLFGNDKNRNGTLDPDEGDGTVDRGLSAYFTVYSREANADKTGKARVNLNGQDLNQLNTQLTQAVGDNLANFILAYKLYGGTPMPTTGTGNGSSGSGGSSGKGQGGKATAKAALVPADANAVIAKVQEDLANMAQSSKGQSSRKMNKVNNLWDLVNTQVQVSVPNGKSTRTVAFLSPLSDVTQQRTLLPMLLDTCTTTSKADLRPRVNAMTASATVLTAFVGLTPLTTDDVTTIITKRPAPDQRNDPVYQTAAWLITDCNLPAATVKALEPYVTGRTQVYRIQSIGDSDRGGPVARVEAVIDTNMGRPRVVYYRDLTELGKGFDLGTGNR